MARCRQMRIASGAERPFGQGLVTLACGAFCQGWEPCGTFGGESHNSWWESFFKKNKLKNQFGIELFLYLCVIIWIKRVDNFFLLL
jgi:hypothetical protein